MILSKRFEIELLLFLVFSTFDSSHFPGYEYNILLFHGVTRARRLNELHQWEGTIQKFESIVIYCRI